MQLLLTKALLERRRGAIRRPAQLRNLRHAMHRHGAHFLALSVALQSILRRRNLHRGRGGVHVERLVSKLLDTTPLWLWSNWPRPMSIAGVESFVIGHI